MNESLASVNHKQIGYRIKEVREQNNFSQAQLAEETELSISYITAAVVATAPRVPPIAPNAVQNRFQSMFVAPLFCLLIIIFHN